MHLTTHGFFSKVCWGTFTTIIAFQYVFEVLDCNVMHTMLYIHLNKFHLSQFEGERDGRKVTDEENNALKCISKIRARIEYMTNEESALRKYGIRANSICLYVTIVSSKLKNVGRRYKTQTGNLAVACKVPKLNFQESVLIR